MLPGNTAYYSTDVKPESGRDIFTFELYPEARPTQHRINRNCMRPQNLERLASVKLVDLRHDKVCNGTVSTLKGHTLFVYPLAIGTGCLYRLRAIFPFGTLRFNRILLIR
jgi:hypothetical protein